MQNETTIQSKINTDIQTQTQRQMMSSELSQDTKRIIYIVDRSGSMEPIKESTITAVNESVNEYITSLSKDTTMSLYTFSDDVLKMSDKVSMDQFPKLNAENYVTGGSTSLLKAINVALSYHKKDGFKYTVVIMTDGRENSSGSKYSIQGTYKLISTLKEKGW